MRKSRAVAIIAALALVTGACGGDDDAADEPAAEEPAGEEPAAEEPAGEEPAAEEPAGEEPAGEEPAGEEPAGEEPAGEEPAGEAGGGGELTLLQWQAPSQANGLLSAGTKDILASSLVLEPLARFNPDGELVATLAAEIPSSGNGIAEDGMSITWKLRDDIVWSDGTPFTSDDVVFTWEYCSDEATGCSTDGFTYVDQVVADDEHTVTVTFTEPQAYPFTAFVSGTTVIIQRAQFQDCVGAAAASCSEQNFAPVGTGPYLVTELRPEDTVTYEINPNYRGIPEGKPFFDTVVIKGGGDAEAAARSVLEIGEADYAWNVQVAPEILSAMEAAGNGVVLSAFGSSTEHINLNQTDPNADPPSEGTPHPLFVDNPDLHRALSIAINRDELVAVGYGPSGKATCNMWEVGSATSTNNDWCLTQDIDGANALLDGLGYLDTDGDGVREAPGFGPLEFDFATSTNAVRQSNQELIASHWEQIGVKANMLNEDASLFFDGTCASDACIWKFFWPMQMFTNNSTTPYGPGYLKDWGSTEIPTSATGWGGGNVPRLNNAEFDAIVTEALALPLDDPGFDDAVIAANDILSTTAVIPLINRASASAFSNSIEGVGTLNAWDSEYWNIQDWTRAG